LGDLIIDGDIIKIDLKETGYECVDMVKVAQNRFQWHTLDSIKWGPCGPPDWLLVSEEGFYSMELACVHSPCIDVSLGTLYFMNNLKIDITYLRNSEQFKIIIEVSLV
jgi:hypothetical protein